MYNGARNKVGLLIFSNFICSHIKATCCITLRHRQLSVTCISRQWCTSTCWHRWHRLHSLRGPSPSFSVASCMSVLFLDFLPRGHECLLDASLRVIDSDDDIFRFRRWRQEEAERLSWMWKTFEGPGVFGMSCYPTRPCPDQEECYFDCDILSDPVTSGQVTNIQWQHLLQ